MNVSGGSGGVAKRITKQAAVCAVALSALLGACAPIEEVRLAFRDATPHEAYLESLQAAGLGETALTLDWIDAAETALTDAPEVSLPFREQGFLFTEEAEARSYRLDLRRGQSLSIQVSLVEERPTRLFVDLYRLRDDRDPVPLASTDSIDAVVSYTASRDGEYVVRVQPELLRGGAYEIRMTHDASMDFPVAGHTTRAIQSRFGVDRDGGRRRHHGVDVFARRNTPVVSATDGIVSRVEVTNLGGNVVWVRDSDQPQSIYYAHLERQLVQQGQQVRKGDTLGLVGNSGNARTTPPHLHFGIYRRGDGPVDPWYFLWKPDRTLAELTADPGGLGTWSRTTDDGIRLRSGPGTRTDVIEELPLNTAIRVLAATGSWYRVRLPDGRSGYIASRLTEPADRPLRTEVLASASPLQAKPESNGAFVRDLAPGTGVDVLGRFGEYWFVRDASGPAAWLSSLSVETEDRD